MTRTLIVPGLDGSPAPHWQHWWTRVDCTALAVDLSDPARPDPDRWEEELAGMILMHPGAVLVGHSLGAVLIARLLTHWPQARVRAALLVAPAETLGNDRIGHFGPIPETLLPVPTLVAGSRNDPWMGAPRARALSESWGADFVDLGDAGHVNVASGFGPWPGGVALRDRLLSRPARHAALPAAARSATENGRLQ